MSWEDHANAMVATGAMTKAAIHGLDGAAWGASPGFEVTREEAAVLMCGRGGARRGGGG